MTQRFALLELGSVCASIYVFPAEIVTLLQHAAIPPEQIALSARGIDSWTNIVLYAHHHNKIAPLVNAIRTGIGAENQPFESAVIAYQNAIDDGSLLGIGTLDQLVASGTHDRRVQLESVRARFMERLRELEALLSSDAPGQTTKQALHKQLQTILAQHAELDQLINEIIALAPAAGEEPFGDSDSGVVALLRDGHDDDQADRDAIVNALTQLDYVNQMFDFNESIPLPAPSVVLLTAAEDMDAIFALKLLLKRLTLELENHAPEELFTYHLHPQLTSIKPRHLWEMLSGESIGGDLSLEADDELVKSQIARRFAQQLKSNHVLLVIDDMLGRVRKLDQVIEQFWQPLCDRIAQDRDPDSGGQLMLMLLDHRGNFNEIPSSLSVLPLPPVENYTQLDIKSWYINARQFLPEPVRAAKFARIWEESDNGNPDLLLDFLCQLCQIPTESLLQE